MRKSSLSLPCAAQEHKFGLRINPDKAAGRSLESYA
jgi:hypothetical protein